MILGSDGKPLERKDCTVEVNSINVKGTAFSQSYIDGNLSLFEQRLIKILREHGGEMHYVDFMREYRRRYENG